MRSRQKNDYGARERKVADDRKRHDGLLVARVRVVLRRPIRRELERLAQRAMARSDGAKKGVSKVRKEKEKAMGHSIVFLRRRSGGSGIQ
ncbi:hypothetical protein VTH06DRAFT_3504 [Thermothelomyces fergusii]